MAYMDAPIGVVALIARMLLAGACGGLVGMQAEIRQRPGGIRTHAMTAMGAALFTLTALSMSPPGRTEGIERVIQGVASGVGFIGAAAVLRGRGTVRGIATAASIWITAAIGCMAATGGWKIACAAAIVAAAMNTIALRTKQGVQRFVAPDERPSRPSRDRTRPSAEA